MATGKEIKRLRGKKSAADIASLIGVKVDRLRKWEERDTDPSDTGDIQMVEQYFGVPLHKLKDLKDFEFVQNPSKLDYKEKLIRSLEKQVDHLEKEVTLLKEELREVALANQAVGLTNQSLLIELVALQRKQDRKKAAFEASKENLLHFENSKKTGNLIGAGK